MKRKVAPLTRIKNIMNVVSQNPHVEKHVTIPEKDKWMTPLKYKCMLLKAQREDRVSELIAWASRVAREPHGWGGTFKISMFSTCSGRNLRKELKKTLFAYRWEKFLEYWKSILPSFG